MALMAVTILRTPKSVAGQIAPTEEILVKSTEVAASDAATAAVLVAAQNSEAVLAAAKDSTLRVVSRAIG